MTDRLKNAKYHAAREIVATLRAAGHQAYFAGGCVRDMVLGVEPKDFDVATSATPDVVMATFAKTYSVGAHFGVVLVCSRLRSLRFDMMGPIAMGGVRMQYSSRPIHARTCCGATSRSTECCLIR